MFLISLANLGWTAISKQPPNPSRDRIGDPAPLRMDMLKMLLKVIFIVHLLACLTSGFSGGINHDQSVSDSFRDGLAMGAVQMLNVDPRVGDPKEDLSFPGCFPGEVSGGDTDTALSRFQYGPMPST